MISINISLIICIFVYLVLRVKFGGGKVGRCGECFVTLLAKIERVQKSEL